MKSVKMVRKVRGIVKELGKRDTALDGNGGQLNAEILSVGPQYQEVDMRWLYQDLRKPPFFRQEPQVALQSI